MEPLNVFIAEKLRIDNTIQLTSYEKYGEGEYIEFDINELNDKVTSSISNICFNNVVKKQIRKHIPNGSMVYHINANNIVLNQKDGIYNILRKYPKHIFYGNAANQIHIYENMKELPNTTLLWHVYMSNHNGGGNDIYFYNA